MPDAVLLALAAVLGAVALALLTRAARLPRGWYDYRDPAAIARAEATRAAVSKLKPWLFFLVGFALSVALFIAAHKAHDPRCGPGGNWFGDVFWALGPPAVAAVFFGTLTYGFQKLERGILGTLGTSSLPSSSPASGRSSASTLSSCSPSATASTRSACSMD